MKDCELYDFAGARLNLGSYTGPHIYECDKYKKSVVKKLLKSIANEEKIFIKSKYMTPVKTVVKANMVFMSEFKPPEKFEDQEYRDIFKIVYMPRCIYDSEDRNPDMEELLKTEEIRNYFITISMDAVMNAIERGYLSKPEYEK